MGGFHIGSAIIPNPELRERFKKQFYFQGHTCERHIRVNLATTHANAEEAFDRIRKYFKG